MSSPKFIALRFHGPVTLFGKEMSNVNSANHKTMIVTPLDGGWIEVRQGNRIAVLPSSTVESIHYEDQDAPVSK